MEKSVGVMAVCRMIARIPTSVSWTLSSLKPPRRMVMATKVGMNVAAVDMATVVRRVQVVRRCGYEV